ncbi:MAG: hypothetical protein AAFV26_04335 [Pseudomonadota bacterium]
MAEKSIAQRLAASSLMSAVLAFGIAVFSTSGVKAKSCSRAEFEAVVDQAGDTLAALNQQNRPLMQRKLRDLKRANSWSQSEFQTKALPLVNDETTLGYDRTIRAAFTSINNLGSAGGEAAKPDCSTLKELQATFKQLVQAVEAKWAHLFGQLDKALAEAPSR